MTTRLLPSRWTTLGDLRMSAQPTASDGRSLTMCPLLRICGCRYGGSGWTTARIGHKAATRSARPSGRSPRAILRSCRRSTRNAWTAWIPGRTLGRGPGPWSARPRARRHDGPGRPGLGPAPRRHLTANSVVIWQPGEWVKYGSNTGEGLKTESCLPGAWGHLLSRLSA